jgi:hypothetical protein
MDTAYSTVKGVSCLLRIPKLRRMIPVSVQPYQDMSKPASPTHPATSFVPCIHPTHHDPSRPAQQYRLHQHTRQAVPQSHTHTVTEHSLCLLLSVRPAGGGTRSTCQSGLAELGLGWLGQVAGRGDGEPTHLPSVMVRAVEWSRMPRIL